jgi:transcriptional regulator with XRE-family HTH domain
MVTAMDKRKLSDLIIRKRNELGMTQVQFAEYFSNSTGTKVTYGFIQALENPNKASTPEWSNMKGIAEIYGLSLDELDLYLSDDSIISLDDVSDALKSNKDKLEKNPDTITKVILGLDLDTKIQIAKQILDDIKDAVQEISKAKKLIDSLRNI